MKMDKRKKIDVLLYAFFIIFLSMINLRYFNNMKARNYSFNNDINIQKILIIFNIVYILVSSIIIYYRNSIKIKLEKLFLLTAIPLGLLYLVFVPIGRAPDEIAHYARAYSISTGDLITKKDNKGGAIDELPLMIFRGAITTPGDNYKNVYNNSIDNTKDTITTAFNTSAVYNFIVYTPQVMGILIGRIFNLPIITIGYLARLANLICFITLVYFSIKLIPFFKKYIYFLSLLPIVLQQSASISSDGLTLGIILFFVSYVLFLKYNDQEKINKNQFIILTISALVLSLCKIVYLPLCLLPYIIPQDKFLNKKDKYIKITLLIIFSTLCNLIWLKVASGYLLETNSGVNPGKQVEYVLFHPFSYIKTLLITAKETTLLLIYQGMGRFLESLEVDQGTIYPLMSFIILFLISYFENLKSKMFENKNKIITFIILFGTIILICTSLYVQWTPLKHFMVNGLQGRYFLPLMVLVPLLFTRKKDKNINVDINGQENKYLAIYTIIQNLNAIFFIILMNINNV